MIDEKFMIAAILMTDVAMTGRLDDMGESGCVPGAMVLTSRLAKQFYRRGDEQLLGMQFTSTPENCSTEFLQGIASLAKRLDCRVFTHVYESKSMALNAP